MFKRIFALAILITLTLIGICYFYLMTSHPQTHGEIKLKGLGAKVEVIRDKWGVPHISAQNEDDLHLVLGYVMASDRLFQMDLIRRIGNGELSEVLGKDLLEFDILLRKLKIRKTMTEFFAKNKDKLDKRMLKNAQKFIEGIHAFMNNNKLPIEFDLIGYVPKKFTIDQIAAISGYLALTFAEGITGDILFGDLYQSFPKEMVDELLVKVQNDQNSVTMSFPKTVKNYSVDKKWFKRLTSVIDERAQSLGLFHGSNAWAVSGSKTESGFPYLANDPHIAFANPTIWYEAHLKSPTLEIYGHFIPGVPFAGLGHNKDKAWGITMSEVDDLDIYVETLSKNGKQVLYKNEWVHLKIEKEVINVKDQNPVFIEVITGPHGPLLDNTKHAVKGKHLAIKWAYHHPENDVISAIYGLSRAKTFKEMQETISKAAAPGFNIMWADKSGDIGWHVMGKIPLRKKGSSGSAWLDGSSGEDEYLGYLNFYDNPHLHNPEKGFIASANYFPEVKPDETHLDGYWQPSQRFERLESLLREKDKFSVDDMKRIQLDTYSQFAPIAVKIIIEAIKDTKELKTITSKLEKWDFYSEVDSIGSSIYYTGMLMTMKEILEDDLGVDRYNSFTKIADFLHAWKTLIQNENSKWWDNKNTQQIETRKEILISSFLKVKTYLNEKLGTNPTDWKWGNLHKAKFKHVFDKVAPLNYVFNLGPYPSRGGFNQLNNMSSKRNDLSFTSEHGPSTRRIIDFSNTDVTWGILPTGNSGHLLSEFHSNQLETYLKKGHRKQIMDLSLIKKEESKTLVFSP